MLETGVELEPDDELESSEAIENRCTVFFSRWSIRSKTPGGPSLSSIMSCDNADKKLELEDALELEDGLDFAERNEENDGLGLEVPCEMPIARPAAKNSSFVYMFGAQPLPSGICLSWYWSASRPR